MTALDLKLIDLAHRALEPRREPRRVVHVPNPLDRCDVCGAEVEFGDFYTTYQSGREIALCREFR